MRISQQQGSLPEGFFDYPQCWWITEGEGQSLGSFCNVIPLTVKLLHQGTVRAHAGSV